jgi:hypothetical protein
MFISLENNKKAKIRKIHNCILNPDTFREKDSLNHSSSKYSLNNSNNSSLSNSKNSLRNKDSNTFHAIIMRMKNRMLTSRNKSKYLSQTEERIKNYNEPNINNIVKTRNIRYKYSNSIDLESIEDRKRKLQQRMNSSKDNKEKKEANDR